jgi:molybdate-binding protein
MSESIDIVILNERAEPPMVQNFIRATASG